MLYRMYAIPHKIKYLYGTSGLYNEFGRIQERNGIPTCCSLPFCPTLDLIPIRSVREIVTSQTPESDKESKFHAVQTYVLLNVVEPSRSHSTSVGSLQLRTSPRLVWPLLSESELPVCFLWVSVPFGLFKLWEQHVTSSYTLIGRR